MASTSRRSTLRSPDAKRYRPLYNTARWRNLRDAQLKRHPLCAWCKAKGLIVEAMVCHHDDPATKDDPSTFFAGPFTSLCKPCHDSEAQQIERTGYSTTIGADGYPIDPRHPANR